MKKAEIHEIDNKVVKEKMNDEFCTLFEDCVCCYCIEFHEDYIGVNRKKLEE